MAAQTDGTVLMSTIKSYRRFCRIHRRSRYTAFMEAASAGRVPAADSFLKPRFLATPFLKHEHRGLRHWLNEATISKEEVHPWELLSERW